MEVEPIRKVIWRCMPSSDAETSSDIPHISIKPSIVFSAQPRFHELTQQYMEEFNEKDRSPNWISCVPRSLRNNVEEVLNYLGMLVAIDFRHWGERGVETPVGSQVENFCKFYVTLPPEESDRHAEKDVGSGRILRGSVAMVYLLKRAVEEYGVDWYRPSYLSQFASTEAATEALRCCFMGHEEDGKTPMWMPATRERVELLLSISETCLNLDLSFYRLWCKCDRYLYHPTDSQRGFFQQLLNLHSRYQDICVLVSESGTNLKIPVLKLAQLTALAFHDVLNHMTPSEIAFSDVHELTICCDYQIPNALRSLGVIEYDNHLSTLVDRAVLLETGGTEESAIRVAALLASEILLKYLQQRGAWDIPSMDHMLWWIGRYHCDPRTRHHLCRTIMY